MHRFFFMRLFTRGLACAAPILLAALASAQTPAPVIFFSDLESGPNTGGENNLGVFVTIWGKNFGASQGTSTVTVGGGQAASYRIWGDPYFWYQKITFQLGPNAQTGNIVVHTSVGDSNGLPFTVRAGHIFFVATTGNDSTGNGSFAGPWATIVKCKNSLVAGDTCYIKGGVVQSAVDNFAAALDIEGAGSPGLPRAIVSYPGATPQPQIGGNSSVTYGIRVPDIGKVASFWVFSGIHMLVNSGDRAVHTNGGTQNWRFIGNKVECPNFNAQAGCFQTTRSGFFYFYGNEVTNVGVSPSSGKQSHAVYFSTDSNDIWVAWNHIHDNFTCRAIQFHSSPIGSGTGNDQFDLHAHDNLIHGDNCDGINFATVDPSKGAVEAYNNVIYSVGRMVPPDGGGNYTCIYQAGILNAGPSPSGTVEVYNNTLWDCGSSPGPFGGSSSGAIGNNPPVQMRLRNNIIYQVSSSTETYLEPQSSSGISGSNNLWFGKGNGPTAFTGNVNADPQFVNLSGFDFHIQSVSPAKDAGTPITAAVMYNNYPPWNGGPPSDHDGVSRPQGAGWDIGGYEIFLGSAPPPPTCDLNGDGVVNNTDVQIAVSQVLGGSACGSADLQQKGSCDAIDIQRVVNAALGQACRIGP